MRSKSLRSQKCMHPCMLLKKNSCYVPGNILCDKTFAFNFTDTKLKPVEPTVQKTYERSEWKFSELSLKQNWFTAGLLHSLCSHKIMASSALALTDTSNGKWHLEKITEHLSQFAHLRREHEETNEFHKFDLHNSFRLL